MVESTLQITFTELETEIGRFLGHDRTVTNWSAAQALDLNAIIKQGLRQFYFPQPTSKQVAMGQLAHRWNFLRPQATLVIWDDVVAADAITVSTATYASPVTTITASAAVFYPSMEEKSLAFDENDNSYVIDQYVSSTVVKVTGDASGETGNTIVIDSADLFTLPWDFGGLAGDGRFAYENSNNTSQSINMTSDARIRLLRQGSVSTGTPYLAAIVPLASATTQGQRHGAMFHPPPNDVFTLNYRYHVLPNALVDTTAEYPYGSVAHSQTILESCLAVAEVREKDSASIVHQTRFLNFLQGSIDHDQKHGQPIVRFGYNGDGSDGPEDDAKTLPTRHNSLLMYNSTVWGD